MGNVGDAISDVHRRLDEMHVDFAELAARVSDLPVEVPDVAPLVRAWPLASRCPTTPA